MKGEGSIKYKGVSLDLVFESEELIPAVWTLSNGDPGYPSEGGEFYILEVWIGDEDCTELLEPFFEDIEEIYLKKHRQ